MWYFSFLAILKMVTDTNCCLFRFLGFDSSFLQACSDLLTSDNTGLDGGVDTAMAYRNNEKRQWEGSNKELSTSNTWDNCHQLLKDKKQKTFWTKEIDHTAAFRFYWTYKTLYVIFCHSFIITTLYITDTQYALFAMQTVTVHTLHTLCTKYTW